LVCFKIKIDWTKTHNQTSSAQNFQSLNSSHTDF
jgi:hypothetical protein